MFLHSFARSFKLIFANEFNEFCKSLIRVSKSITRCCNARWEENCTNTIVERIPTENSNARVVVKADPIRVSQLEVPPPPVPPGRGVPVRRLRIECDY